MDCTEARPRTKVPQRGRIVAALDAGTMRHPVVLPDGTLTDIGFATRSRDPFYDKCPAWCEDAALGHLHVETCDDDRNHYGPTVTVPLRLVSGHNETDRHEVVLASVSMWLQRNVREREPMIWLGRDEGEGGLDLTIDEARTIAEALRRLCDEATE
jgi:hypothetical protein